MAIRVKLPTGEIGEFPDDMPHEEIEAVLQKQFPPAGNQSESKLAPTPFNEQQEEAPIANDRPIEKKSSGIRSDIATGATDLFRNALNTAGGILSSIGKVPDHLSGIKQELKEHPLKETAHIAGQLGVGVAQGLKGLANLALQPLRDPIAEKMGMPALQIPETTGLQKALGLKSNKKGDELIKEIPDIVALGYGATGLLSKSLRKLNKPLPLTKESKYRNAKTEEIIQSKKEHARIKEEHEKLKNTAKKRYAEEQGVEGENVGGLNPTDQEVKAIVKEAKIKELEPLANIPKKEVPEPPPKPDTDAVIAKAKAERDHASEQLSLALKAHENISLKAGAKIQKFTKEIHGTATDLYTKVEKGYKGKTVPADNTTRINDVGERLNTLIKEDLESGESLAPGYGSGTSEQKALEAKIKSLQGETVAASDVYDVQRTLQNRAQKARDASFKPGLDKIERTRLQKLAHQHEKEAVKLGKVLEKVGDPDTKALMKAANENWRKYKDISRSKVGKYINRNEGQIPADTMLKIEGTGKGNAYLRELAKNDPELGRLLFGQKYGKASQQKKVFEKSDLTDKYLKNLPQDVQDKVTSLKVALKNVSNPTMANGQTIKEAKIAHKELTDALTKEATEQATRIKSAEEITKLENQIKFHREKADVFKSKIKEEEAAGRNTDKLKEDLARHVREYTQGDTKLDKLKTGLLKLGVGKAAYELLFKNNHKSE